MTKLLILSDSHGNVKNLRRALEAERDADAVLYLGDGLADMEAVLPDFPHLRLYAVAGNCDFGALEPPDGLIAFEGVLLYYTHGHNYGVKSNYGYLVEAAHARGADVALFGHTHRPEDTMQGGVRLFNPGSCGRSTRCANMYGLLYIEDGRVARSLHKEVPTQ